MLHLKKILKNIAVKKLGIDTLQLQCAELAGKNSQLERQLVDISERIDIGSPYDYPLVVDTPYLLHNIELTNHCPMSCIVCPRPKQMKRSLGFMDIDLFKSIIDQYYIDNPDQFGQHSGWNNTCLHHFGESLLHPHFDSAISYAQEKGLNICISFNPFILNEEKAIRLFQAKPAVLYMMLDGYDNTSFERIRGVRNAYDVSVKNALMAFEYRNQYSPNTDLRLTLIDIPIYYSEINKLVRRWRDEYGIEVQRKKFTNWNSNDPSINALGDSSAEIRAKTCELPEPANTICRTPWTNLSINFDGSVVSCCRDHSNLYPVGDTKKEKIIEIWNNKNIQKLRQEMRSGFVTNTLCKVCERTLHRRR